MTLNQFSGHCCVIISIFDFMQNKIPTIGTYRDQTIAFVLIATKT